MQQAPNTVIMTDAINIAFRTKDIHKGDLGFVTTFSILSRALQTVKVIMYHSSINLFPEFSDLYTQILFPDNDLTFQPQIPILLYFT